MIRNPHHTPNEDSNPKNEQLAADDHRLFAYVPSLKRLSIKFDQNYMQRMIDPDYWVTTSSEHFPFPHSLAEMYSHFNSLVNDDVPVMIELDEEESSAIFNVLFSALIYRGLVSRAYQKMPGILDELIVGEVVSDLSGDQDQDYAILQDLIDHLELVGWDTTRHTVRDQLNNNDSDKPG